MIPNIDKSGIKELLGISTIPENCTLDKNTGSMSGFCPFDGQAVFSPFQPETIKCPACGTSLYFNASNI